MFEGWPGGLRLANLAPGPHTRPEHSTERHDVEYLTRHVTGYVDHEWLQGTTVDERELLTAVASLVP